MKAFLSFLAGLVVGTCLGYCINHMVPMRRGASGHGRRTDRGTGDEAPGGEGRGHAEMTPRGGHQNPSLEAGRVALTGRG
jgi:hypothetical protein